MLPPDGGTEFNRLIHEKSPYLLQHARNPVDWYPWGEEAFQKAEELNRPVFLSVGYSTCHWCHVMAHESFENEDIAALLNSRYIPVKVDREERPDVDALYMSATQVMTRRGGWPNSVWLTPDRRPFFAGTYFPLEDRPGMDGFKTILDKISEVWRTKRDVVDRQADQLTRAVRHMATGQHGEGPGILDRDLVDKALAELRTAFDETRGGFGSRPKFPPHGSLNLLLHGSPRAGSPDILHMATRTLDAMRLGGIHDHVGGGFARYSTDDRWFLPHFEKMLYDNAQLARAYADAYHRTGDEALGRTAEQTYDWVLREMRAPEGAFYSAYDADSEGEEGKFYLWSREEVLAVLGREEGEHFCSVYNVTAEGNYREEATGHRPGTSILHLTRPLKDHAAAAGEKPEAFRIRMAEALGKLRAVREKRVRPHLDDKILVSWNGLMIGSLARGGTILERLDCIEAAAAAADFILENMRQKGRLLRTYRQGKARLNAYLDDYTFLAHGLLDLHATTGNRRWLEEAGALMEVVCNHFQDEDNGGFYFTSDDHEALLARARDPFDQAIPSGNGMAALTLVRLARITGDPKHLETARRTLEAFTDAIGQAPRATESLLLALAHYHRDFSPDATAHRMPLRAEVFLSHLHAAPGGALDVAIRLTVDSGWHIYAHDPGGEDLIPTAVTLKEDAPGRLGPVQYPEGRCLDADAPAGRIRVYEGDTWLQTTIDLDRETRTGRVSLPLEITFQACDDRRCLAPESVHLALEVEITEEARDSGGRFPEIFKRLDR